MLRWSLVLVMAVGCATAPKQYTLHVDLADQSRTVLCVHETDEDEKIQIPTASVKDGNLEKCPRFGNQELSSPATMTIKLENAATDVKYDLRIAQSSREAKRSDVTALLRKFGDNVANFVQVTSGDTEADGPAADLIERVAEKVKDRAPAAAAALLSKADKVADDTVNPEVVFEGYIDDTAKAFNTPAVMRKAPGGISITNAPAQGLPPPRETDLDEAALAYLEKMGLGVDEVADFVIEWCNADSFIPADRKDRYKDLVDREPTGIELSTILAIDRDDLVRILASNGSLELIKARQEALIDEAKDWTKASSNAKSFALMRLGHTLASDMEHCTANLIFMETKAPSKKAELEETADGIGKLSRAATKWANAFLDMFGPLLRDAIIVMETRVELTGSTMSTTISLEPGGLEFGVGQTDSAGSHTEVATYKTRVRGIERVAILLGPVATWCSWGCFDTVEEVVEQPADSAGTAKRTLRKTETDHDFTLATALHITFLSRGDFGLGAILGYPIGAPDQTSTNILVGLGFRHASGLEIAIGFHGMSARRLKDGYSETIDLGIDGNQGLTPDSVTRPNRELGLFALIAFAPSIFNSK